MVSRMQVSMPSRQPTRKGRAIKMVVALAATMALLASGTAAGAQERRSGTTVDLYEITITVARTQPTTPVVLGFHGPDQATGPAPVGGGPNIRTFWTSGAFTSMDAASGLNSSAVFTLPHDEKYRHISFFTSLRSGGSDADSDPAIYNAIPLDWSAPMTIAPILVPELSITFDVVHLPAGLNDPQPIPTPESPVTEQPDDSRSPADSVDIDEELEPLPFEPDPVDPPTAPLPTVPIPVNPPAAPTQPLPEEVVEATAAMEQLLVGLVTDSDAAGIYLAEPVVVAGLVELLRTNVNSVFGVDSMQVGSGTAVDADTVLLPLTFAGINLGNARMINDGATWQLTTASLCGLIANANSGLCTGDPLTPVDDVCGTAQRLGGLLQCGGIL